MSTDIGVNVLDGGSGFPAFLADQANVDEGNVFVQIGSEVHRRIFSTQRVVRAAMATRGTRTAQKLAIQCRTRTGGEKCALLLRRNEACAQRTRLAIKCG